MFLAKKSKHSKSLILFFDLEVFYSLTEKRNEKYFFLRNLKNANVNIKNKLKENNWFKIVGKNNKQINKIGRNANKKYFHTKQNTIQHFRANFD